MARTPVQQRIPVSPEVAEQLPLFDVFPYLTTRLVPTGFHLTLLPDHWSPERLVTTLEHQVTANQFETALVLGPHRSILLSPGDAPFESPGVPRSTGVLSGFLLTPAAIEPSELADRPAQLTAFQAWMNRGGGFLFGDIGKGGHAPSPDEYTRLHRRRRNGVPAGLEQSPTCGEWRGECLNRDQPVGCQEGVPRRSDGRR